MTLEHSARSISTWMSEEPMPVTEALRSDTDADVCVVGGGIAGLTTAYLLAKEGVRVALLERGVLCGGETERTTAHLASAQDDRFYLLERMHGARGVQLAYESHHAAIGEIERIVKEERINCAFRRVDGYLIPGENDDPSTLKSELEASQRAGCAVQYVERTPSGLGPALCFADQGQFQPVAYCIGLAQAILNLGGRIYTETQVSRVTGGTDAQVHTSAGAKVSCNAIVVATNSPINDRVVMHTKQEAYRSYVLSFALPTGALPFHLLWDTEDPYHYVRLHDGGEGKLLLIVGGEDHKTGQANDANERFAALEAWARKRFPAAGVVTERWSGQVLEPIDGLAYIGRNPLDEDNVYIVTGDSGQGMTHGTIAGLLLRDLILKRENPWASLYDPRRKTLSATSIAEFVKANANVALHLSDWLKPGEVSSSDEIASGEGAIVRRGLALEAVHRDEQGRLHACSAVCPHLGGIVHWNSLEKTWDCPLHGSRFDRDGGVIEGPACSGLARDLGADPSAPVDAPSSASASRSKA